MKIRQIVMCAMMALALLVGSNSVSASPPMNFLDLAKAAENGDIEKIKQGIDAGLISEMGDALDRAAMCGQEEIVKLLLEHDVGEEMETVFVFKGSSEGVAEEFRYADIALTSAKSNNHLAIVRLIEEYNSKKQGFRS